MRTKKQPSTLVSFRQLAQTDSAPQKQPTQLLLNLLVGISKNEKVFTLGGLSNVILNYATGAQIAGLSNYVGNEGRGFWNT